MKKRKVTHNLDLGVFGLKGQRRANISLPAEPWAKETTDHVEPESNVVALRRETDNDA